MSSLITSFADIESKEIQWLWNPYITLEKLTLAYGTKETDLTDFMLRFTAVLSTGGTGEPPCSILYFDSEMNAGWIKSKLQAYKADLTTISCLLDTGLAALLKAKDEISRAHIRGIIINGLERLLFTKKVMKASEINPTKRIASELAKRMGLTIQYHPVYEHRGVDSILFFAEDDLVRGTDRMEKGDNGKKERMPEDPDHVSLHDVAEEFEITVMKARKLLITGKLYRDVRGPDAQVCGAWSEHCGPGPFDYRQRQRHVQREEPRLHRVAGAGDPG